VKNWLKWVSWSDPHESIFEIWINVKIIAQSISCTRSLKYNRIMLTIRTERTIPREHRRIYVDDHDLQNRAPQTSLIKPAHGSKLRRSSIQHSSFQFISILLINPGSTWQRIISSIELLISCDLFHQSSFFLAMTMNYFINPDSTLQWIISSIQLPVQQHCFHLSSFYLGKNSFIM